MILSTERLACLPSLPTPFTWPGQEAWDARTLDSFKCG
jgi:hypothetical protein